MIESYETNRFLDHSYNDSEISFEWLYSSDKIKHIEKTLKSKCTFLSSI